MLSIRRFCVMVLAGFLAAGLSVCTPAGTGPLENVTSVSGNRYTCSYDGIKHDFIVDLPEEPEGSALIVMLHGYGQNAETFRMDTGFQKEAVPEGYTLVWVTGAPDPADRTSAAGWNYRDYGEEKRDVDFLKAIVSYMEENYQTDSGRCYAVGFSNGGFMCHRLALEAADTFSAIVSVSGTMPDTVWERRPETCEAGVFQITGEKDNTIPRNSDGSARFSKAPAIEDVMDYYVGETDSDRIEMQKTGKESILAKYRSDRTDRKVWHLLVKDGRHSWSGGSVTGICTNQIILDFLGA